MTQITEDFVSYETANLLKEKGFIQPEICQCQIYGPKGGYEITEDVIYAPTQALAMKWLWKEHKLHVEPSMTIVGFTFLNKWHCFVMRVDNKNQTDLKCIGENFDSYEEAAEAGIRYCLENLI